MTAVTRQALGGLAFLIAVMYAGALIMLLGAPIALGSWWGLVAVPVLIAVIVWRLVDEERLLATSLPGYAEYRARVRYRLVPRVW